MRPDGWADDEWHITIVLNELETPLTSHNIRQINGVHKRVKGKVHFTPCGLSDMQIPPVVSKCANNLQFRLFYQRCISHVS